MSKLKIKQINSIGASAGAVLQTDGTGNNSWVMPAAGGSNIHLDQMTYAGATTTTGNATLTDFFTETPVAGSIDVTFNGVRLSTNQFSVSGFDLLLNMNNIPYSVESGDVIAAQYGYSPE